MPTTVSLSPFRVLFVGGTNTLRSPLAAALLYRRAATDRLAVSVASAGTHAQGDPPDPHLSNVLRDYGVSIAGKRGERIDGPLIDGADLVLTMTCDQASATHAIKSKRTSHIFTLREFTQLLARAGSRPIEESVEQWVERMHVNRTSNYYNPDPSLDLPNVSGQRLLDYKTLGREVDRRCNTIAKLALAGGTKPEPAPRIPTPIRRSVPRP